jgi:hypothetical protein
MEHSQRSRSARQIFEIGEIRPGGWTPRSTAPASPPPAVDSAPTAPVTPFPAAGVPAPGERASDVRLKTVSLSERHLSLAIGAVEHVLSGLRRLPGTEAPAREYETILHALQQALAVLPAPGPR